MNTTLTFLALLAFAPAALLADTASPSSDTVKLDPVVITAAQTHRPLVVTTDPKAPAQPVPAHDGAEALKSVTGFSVIRKGGTDGDPVFRGMAGSRLGVQLDGQCIFGGCGKRASAFLMAAGLAGKRSSTSSAVNGKGFLLDHDDLRICSSIGWGVFT